MEGVAGFWGQSDFISRTVGLLLLAMSVSSWVIILWKGWLLRRVGGDIQRGVAAFWASAASVKGARLVPLIARRCCCRWSTRCCCSRPPAP